MWFEREIIHSLLQYQQSYRCVLTLGVRGGALQSGLLLLEETRGPRNWRKRAGK